MKNRRYFKIWKEDIWFCKIGKMTVGSRTIMGAITRNLIFKLNELEINTEKNEIKNLTQNKSYPMKPFSEIIGKIIAAGGIFKYKP